MYGISQDHMGPRITPKLQMLNNLRQEQEEQDKKMQNKNIFARKLNKSSRAAKASKSQAHLSI
jgi:hypothetical protein